MTRTAAIWIALLASSPIAPASATEPVTIAGRFVLLPEALKSSGLAFDKGPIERQVVLKQDDGTIAPILSDQASRALFLDARLRDRRAEATARRFPGNPYLQVVSFQVEDHGALRTPEYFCDVCTISVRYPQICPCCQGVMTLRFRDDSR